MRGEGVLGTEAPCRGGSRAPCLSCSRSCSQPRCPEQAVQVLSPLPALCGWLLQLCSERYWSRGCLCSFPSKARSVQERGWGWNHLCLVELSHTLQAQPACLVTPGEVSCGECMHCARAAEPHIPERAPQADSRAS